MIDSIEAVHSDPNEDLLEGAHPGLSDAEREARKPDISRLPNALDGDGLPLFRVGEKIIIERRSLSLAGNPYLDTRTYTVLNINYENGNLDLFDEVLAQSALSSYTRGPGPRLHLQTRKRQRRRHQKETRPPTQKSPRRRITPASSPSHRRTRQPNQKTPRPTARH